MTLEAQFEKRLATFTLSVEFSCDAEPLAILGPSGSGKSMTLRCIAGLERPDRGSIVLNGRALFDSEKRIDIPARQREVGLLFQNYALFPHLSVAENISFGMKGGSREERRVRAQKHIAGVHLGGLENRLPRELSGGEQQRVALARALATEPAALLLDEPISALDTYLRSQIEQQLIASLAQFHRPALYVTHNMEEAYRIAPRIVVLSKGRIDVSGTREQIFRHPPSLEVALLTGLKNFSRARAISSNSVEALDWGCTLFTQADTPAATTFVGIRAHHLHIASGSAEAANSLNALPCWLAHTNEAPFNTTLYLRLHSSESDGYHLQAEVTKETWELLKVQPQPWRVILPPNDVLLFPR